jgi:tocopherol O-methyltransferase
MGMGIGTNTRKNTIIHYYDVCESDYRYLWDLDRSLAMHAGYWDETTKTLHDALIRENEILAECAKIVSTDHVLDAGCGVGGSSIFLAERYRCRVTGITLSQKQAEKGAQCAQMRHLANPPQFLVRDFCCTEFPNHLFDVVWALESMCHAENKQQFVKEAYRILKPGGRLVVADGFAGKKRYSSLEESLMSKWLRGWGVDALETTEAFESHLQHEGFHHIQFKDITTHVLPSSKRLFYISLPAIVLSKLGEWLRRRSKIQTANIRGAYYQYKTIKQNLWNYGIFFAEKPRA